MANSQLMKLDLIQASAIDKLSRLRAGALFMKMGTGKTKVAMDWISQRINRDSDIVIWIAPASLLNDQNYRDEMAKWCDFMPNVRTLSVESISMSDEKFMDMLNLADSARSFCIVDESIKIKNLDAKRTRRLIKCYDRFDFRLILNGTPTTRSILDLLPQINFISPNILNMTEAQFANYFMEYYKDGYRAWRRWSKPANEAALVETIRPYIFDADLDIPVEMCTTDIECQMNEQERDNYRLAKDESLRGLFINFLEISQKLQHTYTVCDDKYRKLMDIVGDEQLIIFVKYLDEVDRLLEMLPNAAEYSGRHKANLADFEAGRYQVLICTYGTGAFGLNLQFCHRMAFLTQTFDYKDKIQAMHRIYRTGQTKDVEIYNFFVDVGLECIIRSSLDKKERTLDNIIKCIKDGRYECL